MTIDTFVQIVALIVALYALIPHARQLEVRIHIGTWEIATAAIYFCATVYLLFYTTFLKLGWAKEWTWEVSHGISPGFVSFWITILFVVFIGWRLRENTLPRKSIFKFQELAEGFLQREEYSDLISLFERYWDALIKIEHNQFLFPKLKFRLERYVLKTTPEKDYERLLASFSDEELQAVVENKEFVIKTDIPKQSKIKYVLRNLLCTIASFTAKLLPDYKLTSSTAGDIVRAIMSNAGFIDALSKIKPYYAIRILKTDYFPRNDIFFELFIKSLLLNPQSVLYFEVSNIINSSYHLEKELPKSNRLLYFLLNDANQAEKMSVWKPVGDEVLRFLEERSAFPEKDSYNFPINDFGGKDIEIEQSPLHVGIRFFDIMVTRAVYQGVKSHMWLYYFHHFVEKIVKNYNPHSSVDFSREYPDRYSKFLSDIIDVYEGWIGFVRNPALSKQSNVILESPDNFQDNWKIPKSSIIDLGFSLDEILLAQNIRKRFKVYLMDGIFRLYFELRKDPVTENYGKVLFAMLKGKGLIEKKEFRETVMICFQQIDQIPYRMHCPELFEEFLRS